MKTQRLVKTFGVALMAATSLNCMSGGAGTGPATCKDAKATYGVAADGPQTLYIGGDKTMPWSAYCVGMASTNPEEYLELPQFDAQGRPANFSEFIEAGVPPAGGGAPSVFEVLTHYDRVRVDPVAMTIDITDNRFTHSDVTGLASGGSPTSVALGNLAVGFVPYGVAMQCGADVKATGPITADANIDLAGLPFVLTAQQLCAGVGGSTSVRDPVDGNAIINFHALGQTSGSVLTCGRASVDCVPDPAVNGKVGGQAKIGIAYVGTMPGFGF